MSAETPQSFIGLGKTLFNSSVGFIAERETGLDIELILSERLLRQKASGAWPEKALENLRSRQPLVSMSIGENRDVHHPRVIEEFLNSKYPFFEHLKRKELAAFSSWLNPKVQWIPHHRCHAMAATLMSPFDKALIVVMDGAGSAAADFSDSDSEKKIDSNPDPKGKRPLEECSVYLMDQGRLQCVYKNWQNFFESKNHGPHQFSEGLGSIYEKIAEFIFGDKRAAGKVMGLAAFGQPSPIRIRSEFLETLDWNYAFQGKGKADWENSGNFSLYANVAASIQQHFEDSVLGLVESLHKKYPEYRNLILTGGCALNCTTNMKIFNKKFFDGIYVPPFPGDESIGLGAASYLFYQSGRPWEKRDWEIQHGYFGSPQSVPTDLEIEETFKGFHIVRPPSIAEYTAQKLADGSVVGWFQGRSETGPRALGNRSILARADRKGIKDHLNHSIKMREDFRPYGSSVLFEKAHEYFEIPVGFENPFMSFAVQTRPEYLEKMREINHYDKTSRMQTVRQTQNPLFHELIRNVGVKTGLFCVLNTSLNVMGEPIVENVEDAKRFLVNTPVDALAIGPYYITR